ncbi:uncharacterized protein LOC134466126 [Engraulis encrasicolus]|uniref:uncharacterized protein LOC134466126 n=1 Tax=Engraulis encrasicolus TaxID=184585 RepID=UPI002FD1FAFB
MRPFRMKCLWVVLLVLHSIQRANTVIPKVVAPGLVRGVVGDDLILPCYLENNVSAVDMDVLWLIGSEFVHRYKTHQDVTDNQLPEYRKRTTLSREEMLRGNVSLKISKLRLSDTNTYRCYVSADRGYDVASLHVQVNEFDLMTSAVSHTNGSTTLTCKTPNWPDTTKPTLKWLDSKQLVLKDTHISYYGLTGTTFSMQGRVTVQEKPNNTYTCRVSYEDTGYKTEKSLEVPGKYNNDYKCVCLQSEQIPEKRRIINLQFLKTKLKSDDLRRLSEEVVPKSLKDSQSQNISCCLSIEVEKDRTVDSKYASLLAEISDDKFQLNVEFWTPEINAGQQANPPLLRISLTLPPSQVDRTDWKDYLLKVHQLRAQKGVVQDLCSPNDLEKLEIDMTRLTDWASVLCSLHARPSLQRVVINAPNRSILDNHDFSCVTLTRVNRITRIRMDHTMLPGRGRMLQWMHAGINSDSESGIDHGMCRLMVNDSSGEPSALITLPTREVSSRQQCTEILNMIQKIKNEENQEESVMGLLSKGVVETVLPVNCISVSLAATVLSSNNSNIEVCIFTQNYRDKDNVCAQLRVKKDEHHFEFSLRDSKVSSSALNAPLLSGIQLKLPNAPVNMDWKKALTCFRSLRRKSNTDVDVHLRTLLSCLSKQHGLKELDLYVSCLGESLKQDIKSLMEDCPSLVVRVSCGYNCYLGDDIIWVVKGNPEDGWTEKCEGMYLFCFYSISCGVIITIEQVFSTSVVRLKLPSLHRQIHSTS